MERVSLSTEVRKSNGCIKTLLAVDLDVAAPVITIALQRRLRSRSEAHFSDCYKSPLTFTGTHGELEFFMKFKWGVGISVLASLLISACASAFRSVVHKESEPISYSVPE